MDILNRLKPRGNVVNAIGKAGMFLATGQDQGNTDDELLRRMKLEQDIQTGTPEFKMQQAQALADTEMANKLRFKDAEIQAERQRRGLSGQSTQATQTQPNQSNGPTPPDGKPMPNALPSMWIQQPSTQVYDESVGMDVPKPGNWVQNPDYLDPVKKAEMKAADEQKVARDEMIRSEGLSQLQAIRNAKKGLNFFGPYGGEQPSTFMGFPNPLVGTTYPGGSKISDRTDWEANLENLKAQKMIDLMIKMKEASKTGATGFGQLSEKEGQVLMDASMKLRRNLDPKQASVYIDQMEALQMKALGMPLSPEQQKIIDDINSGTYPTSNSQSVGSGQSDPGGFLG